MLVSVKLQLAASPLLPFWSVFSLLIGPPPVSTLFPYTTLFRSAPSRLRFAPGPLPETAPAASERPNEPLPDPTRSEEHTSELQSHSDLVCRLLLEKKYTI